MTKDGDATMTRHVSAYSSGCENWVETHSGEGNTPLLFKEKVAKLIRIFADSFQVYSLVCSERKKFLLGVCTSTSKQTTTINQSTD
jgi:hypothetical protein